MRAWEFARLAKSCLVLPSPFFFSLSFLPFLLGSGGRMLWGRGEGVNLGDSPWCLASGVVLVLGCSQRVEHEHADGHGTYSARHGGDGRAQGGYRLEVHVALKAESAGA